MSAPLESPSQVQTRTQLEGLLELTKRLSEPLESAEVARVVVDQAQAAVGATTTIMWTVDDPPTHATMVRAIGLDPGVLDRYQRIPLEPWLPMGDAMLRREPLFFESRAEFRQRYEIAERPMTGREFAAISYACLPLVVHGRAIGGVSIVFSHERTFEPDERMFLTVLAHHAAQALERANLVERERRVRRRLESLQQLTSVLSSAVTVEEVALLATRVGVEALGFEVGFLWATDENGDLQLLAEQGMRSQERETFRHIPIDSMLPVARVARERRPQWCESERDIEGEHASIIAAVTRGPGFRAYVLLPLVRHDRVLGVIGCSTGGQRSFSPEERAFMSSIAAHCADAFARARLYDEAHRMERLLHSVLKRLPVGVIVSRPPDSTLVLSNDAMTEIWRTDGFPLRGEERCQVMKATFPDGRPMPMSESPVVRALRGEVVDSMAARIERQDGSHGWIQVSAAPVLRDDGSVEVAVATFVDLTAEKDARAAADEAGRAKDEFLAMLGHELRNPLAAIGTALDVMRLRAAELVQRERAVIERQVKHLTRLVDDLLDVSRAVRGGLRLERAPIELWPIVADAIEVAGPAIEERRHQLSVAVPRSGLVVDADGMRLTQVIVNLLNNAAKYTPPDGHLTVSARADGDWVAIEVGDDGAGIEPDLLPHIFDAFTQGRQGLDRKQGGLGLGLAVARQLVVGHGGTIEARSGGAGRGTSLLVRLPGASVRDFAEEEVAEVEPRPTARRVLIVDDNTDLMELLANALVAMGYEVKGAGDGPRALELVETFVPDVALLDIGLPVMDGYELAGLLRRMPKLRDTPLVALTGYAQDVDRQRALESGFSEHFAKPLDLDRLVECLERLAPGRETA
jgi:signal transduction histidine kinase/ActR/RegA family two-component response regulator/transcriptional regulator with GAF, ATPase, and Fis domain